MRTAIVNIAQVLTGSLDDPLRQGDTIVMDDGVIESVGPAEADAVESCDVVIDAGGTIAARG